MRVDANQVADRINSFNIPGWINLSAYDIIVKPLGEGYINSTYKVDKVTKNDPLVEGAEPASLVYKEYGGNKFAEHAEHLATINCASTQLLISYELSRRRWGPKLYGSFENGRIEEYVDCHTLRPADAFSDEVSADLAITMARFHSLDLPLVRHRENFLQTAKLSFDREREPLSEWVRTCDAPTECLETFKFLLDFPSDQEYNWIDSAVNKIKHRRVLSSGDANYLNRLVRKGKPITSDGTRCMIIDYDLTKYHDRGSDLGSHFVMRLFDPAGKDNKLSGFWYPSREERDHFLERYLEECSRLFEDFDTQDIDNMDHLRMEADIYAVFYCLWLLFVCATSYKIHQVEPNLYTIIKPIAELYFSLKQEFCANYRHTVED